MKRFLILLVVAIIFSGCSASTYSPKVISKTDAKSVVQFIEKELNDAKLRMQFSITEPIDKHTGYVWWISKDNKNILIDNAFSITSEISVPAVTMNEVQKADFAKNFSPMENLVDKALTNNGFTKNIQNSSESLDDYKFTDYVVAYEKFPTVCTFTLDADLPGDAPYSKAINFACSDEFQKYYDEQIPYLNALSKADQANFAVTNIEQVYGEFSKVDLSLRRTGHYSIFKSHYVFKGLDKQNFEYTEIYSGQEAPPCKIVDKYKIPKEITAICWSDDGLTEKKVK